MGLKTDAVRAEFCDTLATMAAFDAIESAEGCVPGIARTTETATVTPLAPCRPLATVFLLT
jgi:hypothetical protein